MGELSPPPLIFSAEIDTCIIKHLKGGWHKRAFYEQNLICVYDIIIVRIYRKYQNIDVHRYILRGINLRLTSLQKIYMYSLYISFCS